MANTREGHSGHAGVHQEDLARIKHNADKRINRAWAKPYWEKADPKSRFIDWYHKFLITDIYVKKYMRQLEIADTPENFESMKLNLLVKRNNSDRSAAGICFECGAVDNEMHDHRQCCKPCYNAEQLIKSRLNRERIGIGEVRRRTRRDVDKWINLNRERFHNSDGYIAALDRDPFRHLGEPMLSSTEMPPELIELKRKTVQIKRIIKNEHRNR